MVCVRMVCPGVLTPMIAGLGGGGGGGDTLYVGAMAFHFRVVLRPVSSSLCCLFWGYNAGPFFTVFLPFFFFRDWRGGGRVGVVACDLLAGCFDANGG